MEGDLPAYAQIPLAKIMTLSALPLPDASGRGSGGGVGNAGLLFARDREGVKSVFAGARTELD